MCKFYVNFRCFTEYCLHCCRNLFWRTIVKIVDSFQSFDVTYSTAPGTNTTDVCFVAGYQKEGFLAIQRATDQALLDYFSTTKLPDSAVDVKLRRHPYPPYEDDQFVLVIQKQLPLIIMLGFIFLASNLVKSLVHEKERKLKVSKIIIISCSWRCKDLSTSRSFQSHAVF